MEAKFYNKNGELNIYGLSCGYVEQKETKSYWKKLYIEHSHFHVMKGYTNQGWKVWETFEINELTKARKLYYSRF